jgi:hypothetical protein
MGFATLRKLDCTVARHPSPYTFPVVVVRSPVPLPVVRVGVGVAASRTRNCFGFRKLFENSLAPVVRLRIVTDASSNLARP